MILEKWPELPPVVRICFLVFSALLAIISGLLLSGYVLSRGLGFSFDPLFDIFIWPRVALGGYEDSEITRWVKLSGFASVVPSLLIAFAFLKNNPKQDVHGKVRYATESEIKEAQLRAKTGVITGFTGALPSRHYGYAVDRYGRLLDNDERMKGTVKVAKSGHLTAKNLLVYGGDEHVFLYAPTRTGKGVAVVVPNLLNWPDSTIVMDIKKENWHLTAGYRAKSGQDVFLFDPLDQDGKTHCWNPLSTVRRGTEFQVEDLQRIASLFIPVQSKDPFFDLAAQTALVGVGGYLAETPELPFTLGEIYRQLTLHDNVIETFREVIEERQNSKTPLSMQTVSALNDFLSKSNNTFESVKSTITANLGLFANPMLDRATSKSDFDFADLRKKRMSIYVGITPNNLKRLGPLLSLFFQSCVYANTQELPEHNPALKYKLLLCMDEFTAPGEMPIFKDGIAYFAGYGLKVLTVIQTPSQLRDVYGVDAADAYMGNAGIEIIFTPKNLKDAQNISATLGTYGVESRSESRSKYFMHRKGTTVNTSSQKRDLMMPQELRAMKSHKALILVSGHPPIRANKLRFYAEQAFLERSKIPPPQIQSINTTPIDEKLESLEADAREARQERDQMRGEMASMRDQMARVTALAAMLEENVANGEPATVEMTDEEIEDPDSIGSDRLCLDHSSARSKVAELRKSGKLTSREGAKELLFTLGVDLPRPTIA